MEVLTTFFGRAGYLPHGYCITWSASLLWTMVVADAMIAAAYFSIPLAIVSFVRQRRPSSHIWVPWLFSAFIFACGLTHVMAAWTLWQPDYGLEAVTKAVTAVVSLATAIALWPLIPRALRLPSVSQLQAAIASLEAEVRKRKTAEENLLDIEQSLAVTLASIDAGFIATDAQGRVSRMNAVAEQVTGWQQAEALGRSLWQVFVREGRPAEVARRNPVDLIVEQGIRVSVARHPVAISRDGRRIPLELKAALRRTDDGQTLGMAMVFRDMSRLNRAESEAYRLAAIVESSSDAIVGKDLQGRITSWNRAAETLFGYNASQAIGQPVKIVMPAQTAAGPAGMFDDMAGGHSVPALDTVCITQDGRPLAVSVAISPIRDALGAVVGASMIMRDVSQQRRAEAALRDSEAQAQRLEAENRQVQEASRLKSQFLANMSHELRTPLNAIIGFAELLKSGAVPAESPKHQLFVGHIATSGHHLLQLINDVLDLSKVESGKFEFQPEPVDLPLLVGEVCNVLQTTIQRKRLAVEVQLDPSLTGLVLDPARLKQALYNYLSNAIKFTPEGGRITVRTWPQGAAHFRLEVEDTGIGVAEADLPRLFVEFQQLDAGYAKQHSGTGLGLALTRRLVEAQGGSVGVRSHPGLGSVFHLVLPRVHGQAAPTLRRLLVIEQDRQLQAVYQRTLSEAGLQVDAASSADQALQAAARQAYDAISLSLQLPDQGGLAALADIRTQGPSRASPVRGMTMGTGAGDTVGFPIADVLGKPLRTDEVAAAMARLAPPPGRPTRVMVIDDDPLALALMRATLAAIGIEVLGHLQGRQALHEIDRERPDAIVLDLMMPEFDGFAVLDALRRMPAWCNTPVYVWTSMLLTGDEFERLSRSAQAVLDKGGGALHELLDTLRRGSPAATLPGVAG